MPKLRCFGEITSGQRTDIKSLTITDGQTIMAE
jgi:hypothetical protein